MARFRGNTVDGIFYYMHIIMSIKGMNIFVVNLNGDIYILGLSYDSVTVNVKKFGANRDISSRKC